MGRHEGQIGDQCDQTLVNAATSTSARPNTRGLALTLWGTPLWSRDDGNLFHLFLVILIIDCVEMECGKVFSSRLRLVIMSVCLAILKLLRD